MRRGGEENSLRDVLSVVYSQHPSRLAAKGMTDRRSGKGVGLPAWRLAVSRLHNDQPWPGRPRHSITTRFSCSGRSGSIWLLRFALAPCWSTIGGRSASGAPAHAQNGGACLSLPQIVQPAVAHVPDEPHADPQDAGQKEDQQKHEGEAGGNKTHQRSEGAGRRESSCQATHCMVRQGL